MRSSIRIPKRTIVREEITSVGQVEEDRLCPRKETAELLDISISTLSNWTKSNVLTPEFKGRRVYFRYSDIMESKSSHNKGERPVYYKNMSAA